MQEEHSARVESHASLWNPKTGDRRRYPRADGAWKTTLEDGHGRTWSGDVVALSPFGMKVRLNGRSSGLLPGTLLRMPLDLSDGEPPLSLKGIVWREDPDGAAIVLLLGLSVVEFHRLKTFVDTQLGIPN